MRNPLPVLACLVVLAVHSPPAAGQPWDPGALLDRADLDSVRLGTFGGFGPSADVKGTPKDDDGFPIVRGRLGGGDYSSGTLDYRFLNSGSLSTSGTSTLLPPFANGALFATTFESGGFRSGRWMQALLYEPDQVKKSTSPSGSKLILKQKGSLGFRVGSFSGTGFNASVNTVFKAPGCKAQANFATKTKAKTGVYKFKVRCGNRTPEEQFVRVQLEALFGKPRGGFDLQRVD